MKKSWILIIVLSIMLVFAGCSSSGDGEETLPAYSTAPESSRVAAEIAFFAVIEIIKDIDKGVDVPGVEVTQEGTEKVVITFSKVRVPNVEVDNSIYDVLITGSLTVSEDKSIFDITDVKCKGDSRLYQCSVYLVNAEDIIEKIIIDGKEYDPAELNEDV